MSKFSFPYGIRFREDGKVETFPAVEIFILGKKKQGIRAIFHLDSGATTSILPAGDDEVLGVNFKKGERVIVRGIFGEPREGYRHLVTLQFNNLKLKTTVIFLEGEFVPRILGREDIFSQFGILFDESKQRTLFLEAKRERKTLDSLFKSNQTTS